mgnify:CR=1 FL=1
MIGSRKRLGEILKEWGIVTEDQITQALERQAKSGRRIGEVLVSMGACEDADVSKALAMQFDMEFVDLDIGTINPQVMEMIPENGAEGVEMSETIELLFSKAIDRSSLYSSLQIEPPLDVEYNWGEDDRRVELVPRSSLSAGTCYRVSVSRACTCSEGISLDEVHGASFTTVGEHGPDLTEILIRSEGTEREPDEAEVYEIEKDDLLTFSFAPPVPEAEHDSVIEFSAHADSSVEWSENGSSAELSFDEHLLWQELYICRILENRYSFLCAGEESRPPRVEDLHFCNDTGADPPEFSRLLQNQLLRVEDSDRAAIDIHISHGDGAELDYSSLIAHTSLHATNGCLSLSLTSIKLNPADPAPPPPESTDAPHSTVRINFSLTSGGRSGRLILEIGEEMRDTYDNTLAQSFLLSLNI